VHKWDQSKRHRKKIIVCISNKAMAGSKGRRSGNRSPTRRTRGSSSARSPRHSGRSSGRRKKEDTSLFDDDDYYNGTVEGVDLDTIPGIDTLLDMDSDGSVVSADDLSVFSADDLSVDQLFSPGSQSTISIVEQIVTPAVLVEDSALRDILPPESAVMSPISATSSRSSHRALEEILGDPDDDDEEVGYHGTVRGKGSWGQAEMPTEDPGQMLQSGVSTWGDISPKLMNLAKYSNVLQSQEMYGTGMGGGDTAMETLHKLTVEDLSNLGDSKNFDPHDPEVEDSRQSSGTRVQRLYNQMMGRVIAKPVLDQMAMLMYPGVPAQKVETASVQKLLLEIAKGVVTINDRGAGGVTQEHSAQYWMHKDPLAEFKGGKIAFNVEMQPPNISRTLSIDIKGRMMGAELYERVERASREMGYDPYSEYYLEILKSQEDNDTEQHPDNRVKRAQRVGELGTTELVTKWVPKNCTILFINYFDGKEYPVTMNSRTKAGKLYDVAKSILLNSTYPHAPERMELYRYNEYDEALENTGEALDAAAEEKRTKQLEGAQAKAEEAVKLTREGVVSKLKNANLLGEADAVEALDLSNISTTLKKQAAQNTVFLALRNTQQVGGALAESLITPLVESLGQFVKIAKATDQNFGRQLFGDEIYRSSSDESAALLLQGLIPEDSEDPPCAGYRKSKIYMVCQREDGKCTPHYIFGNDPPTLDNIVIGDRSPVDRFESNGQVYKRAIRVAKEKGYLRADTDEKKIHIFASPNHKIPKTGETGGRLRFCKYFGDALIRVVSDISPPTSKVVFKTPDGRKRSTLLRLDASVRELYQAAVKLLGVHYLPKNMRQRYIDSGEVPSLAQMEDVLNVQLYVGRTDATNGTKINAQTLVDKTKGRTATSTAPIAVDIDVEFFTRDGGDWNSCVIQLYMSFSGSNKLYSNRYIPNLTLVMDSSETNAEMYDKVRQHVSQYINNNTDLNDIQIKSHDGNTLIAKDSKPVCSRGGQHFMVYLKQTNFA